MTVDPELVDRLTREGDQPPPLFDPLDPADPVCELALFPRPDEERSAA